MLWDSESCLNPKENYFLFCSSRQFSRLHSSHRLSLILYGPIQYQFLQYQFSFKMFSVLFTLAPQMYYSGQSGTWEVFILSLNSLILYMLRSIYTHIKGRPSMHIQCYGITHLISHFSTISLICFKLPGASSRIIESLFFPLCWTHLMTRAKQ